LGPSLAEARLEDLESDRTLSENHPKRLVRRDRRLFLAKAGLSLRDRPGIYPLSRKERLHADRRVVVAVLQELRPVVALAFGGSLAWGG
jgi:hypothetical protein